MKKYFIFAAIATAGLFASCSSSDDAISENSPLENGDRTAIKVGVGTPAAVTRGTGTVGGVGTSENAWHGQIIKVFMFNQNTLTLTPDPDDNTKTLYDNTAMYTPGTDANIIPGMSTPAPSGEAMIQDGTIQYYPVNGNFDFFGYHADDAVAANATIDKTTDEHKWTVPFTITGSQDLMSTKAALTGTQSTTMGTSTDYYSAKAARKGVDPTLTFKHLLSRLSFVAVAGNDNAAGYSTGAPTVTDYTKAAFDVLDPTNDAEIIAQCVIKDYTVAATVATTDWPTDAAVIAVAETYWEPDAPAAPTVYNKKAGVTTITKAVYDALPAALQDIKYFTIANYTRTQPGVGTLDPAKAVKINSIKIKSKTTGTLLVAWDDQAGTITDADKIEFASTDAGSWLTLMDRPAYKKIASPAASLTADDFTDLAAQKAALDNTATDYGTKVAALDAIATARYTDQITAATFALLTNTANGNYEAIPNKEKENLIALTPTSPTIDATKADAQAGRYPETAIGEALIVAPKSELVANSTTDYEGYEMEVSLSQYVKSNWNPTPDGAYEVKTQTATYTINAPSNADLDLDDDGNPDGANAQKGFLQNVSYKVKLTVYGWERIVVTAVIEPWIQGETIGVGADE